MELKKFAALLIEDDPGDARLIRRMLELGRGNFGLEWVDRLVAGVERIAQGGIDLVLLDLGLPESSGLETLRRLRSQIPPSVAVLVLSGHGDEEIGAQAVQEGAQDYLVKGEIDGRILHRAMRYALERQEAEEALRKERAELERQVLERTAKLASTVESLEKENAERRRTEQLLSEAEAKYRCLVEESLVGVYLIQQGRFIYVNQRMAQIFGFSREELAGLDIYSLVAAEDRERVMANVQRREKAEVETIHYTFRGVRKDLQCIDVVVLGTRTVYNGRPAVIGSILDVTEQKRSEEALRRLNRELRAISNCNQRLMRAQDEPSLLEDICRIVCEDADYRMAWVGFAEEDSAKTLRPVAWAGHEEGYLEAIKVSWSQEDPHGLGPAGIAIREGRSGCIQDFNTDPRAACWREEALRRGYRSTIALPLKSEKGEVFGAFVIYAAQPNAYTPQEVRLLEELAEDLAFGIAVVRARAEREQAEQQLRALNEELERRVADRTRELRLKTAFLEAQSNSTIDGILVIDPEGNKLFQNRRCMELFHVPLQYAEDPCDERQFHWVTQQVKDPQQFIQRVLWLYSHPKEIAREEIELTDGSVLDRYSAPVIDQEGTYYGRLWNFRDITERKQAQQKLEEALRKEIVLRREVHHRVKNNLQVIISLLYLQSTKVDDPVALALLRESQVRVHSIAIVHEMLYQREDLGQISFADYVRQLSADLFIAFRVSQREVNLVVEAQGIFLDLQSAIPCGIIVTELLTNALKYAFRPETPGELRVAMACNPAERSLVLTVQDDGVGLPSNLDARRAQTLGLSLVRDLSKQLGGTVDFRQAPCGHGTLIEIVFPEHRGA